MVNKVKESYICSCNPRGKEIENEGKTIIEELRISHLGRKAQSTPPLIFNYTHLPSIPNRMPKIELMFHYKSIVFCQDRKMTPHN